MRKKYFGVVSKSSEDTQKVGRDIGKNITGGEIIFLSGVLGAGKTELVRGIAKGLGIKSKISSPTFNIFKVYDFVFPRRNIACYVPVKGKFYHFDCYRLKKYSDLMTLGWEEIIADKNSVVVLEWPECILDKKINNTPGNKIMVIEIKISGNNRRISKS